MNNKIPNQNRNLLDTQRTGSNNSYDQFLGGVGGDITKARGDAADLFTSIKNKYETGFLPPGLKTGANGWFDTSGMPGAKGVMPDYSSSREGYQKFADTGGINRGDWDASNKSYQNFMDTGGINSQAIRNSVNQTLPGYYEALKNNMSRRANVQGGYAPGFDAGNAELTRQLGREKFKAGLDAESQIAGLEQQGRMFGTSGSASNAGAINSLEQSGKLSGLGGLKDIATNEASFGNADADRQQQLQMALMSLYANSGQASASGLQGLYSSAPGALGQSNQDFLSGLSGKNQNELGNLGIRGGINNRSLWDLVPGLAGAAGGAVAGIYGGGKR